MRIVYPDDDPPPPLEWLAAGLVPSRGLTVLSGPPGAGKSALALALAVASAQGGDWLDRTIAPRGPALWLAYEASESTLRRLRALDPSAPVAVASGLESLLEKAAHHEIAAALEAAAARFGEEISLVVVDAFAAAMRGGDENSGRDVGRALAPLLAVAESCAVVLLTHTGKSADAGTRGHSSVAADATAALAIVGSGSRRVLRTLKQRDAEEAADIPFSLAAEGEKLTVHAARESGAAKAGSIRLSKDAAISMREFARLSEIQNPVEISAWREATFAAFGDRSPGAKRQAFSNARASLRKHGFIVESNNSVSVSDASASVSEWFGADAASVSKSVSNTPLYEGGADVADTLTRLVACQ